jgi:hypothetical protein
MLLLLKKLAVILVWHLLCVNNVHLTLSFLVFSFGLKPFVGWCYSKHLDIHFCVNVLYDM